MSRAEGEEAEEELLGRVLDTLLREDAYRLRSRARTVRRTDGDWLRIALREGGNVLLPVEPEGFQCEIRARRPAHLEYETPTPAGAPGPGPARAEPGSDRTTGEGGAAPQSVVTGSGRPHRAVAESGSGGTEVGHARQPGGGSPGAEPVRAHRVGPRPDRADGGPGPVRAGAHAGPGDGVPAVLVRGLDAVLGGLRGAVAVEDRELYDVFVGECHRALDAARLHARIRPGVVRGLAVRYGEAGRWAGMGGGVAYDTLAAFRDHPVYPTSRARSVFGEDALRAHAPEFAPRFALRWLALPREAVGGDPGRLPAWWPKPGELGLPARLDADHLAFPVHPLTVGRPLTAALDATGLRPRAHLAERPWLEVRPTLSMRTVAVTDDPLTHLKLPLTTATLGMRNRRTVKPGTLVDGEVAQRLVGQVIAREPRFANTVLMADETTHLHAGHELLATLVRRYPPGLENAQVVPLAGLLARTPDASDGGTPDGTLVVDALAERHYGGDVLALFDAYLTLLFDFHTTLFAYGIALESHQQNTSLVFDDTGGPAAPRLRLLIKDHDGPRVHAIRLAAMIGGADAADLCGFDDRRILTGGDGPVADVFTTITVHLCAAALAFELAALGRAPLDVLLRQLRDRLTEAVDRLGAAYPGRAAAVLRARVLDADRLPVKAMVTAGTLFTKDRSGAADVNKHYVTGPNYLLRGRGR